MEEQHTSTGRSRSRQQCLSALRGIPDPVFICDSRGKIKLINPAFAALAGKPEEELLGSPAALLEPPELARLLLEQNDDVLIDGETRVFEVVLPSASGLRFFGVTKGMCQGCRKIGAGVFGIMREITKALAIEREIIDSSDREKERLGHELRENFCQHLVGISLLGNVLYEELARAGLEEQARFAQQITTLVKEVVSEVRTLEKSLSVAHLEQGEGLVEALRDLAELMGLQHKVACTVEAPVAKPALPPQTAMYLFRIAQEAVHSALHRPEVQRIIIRIRARQGTVTLSVRDDSGGFPKRLTVEEWARGEFPVMHHRSRVIGAVLEFHRFRGGGVEVVCRVPYHHLHHRRRARATPKAARKVK